MPGHEGQWMCVRKYTSSLMHMIDFHQASKQRGQQQSEQAGIALHHQAHARCVLHPRNDFLQLVQVLAVVVNDIVRQWQPS